MGDNMHETRCNKCKHKFRISKLATEKVKGDIECVYFTCPKCNEKYISFYTNDYIRHRQDEIKRLKKEMEAEMDRIYEELA